MTKEEYLSIAESHYAEFEGLKESPTFYDYEKSLDGLMQNVIFLFHANRMFPTPPTEYWRCCTLQNCRIHPQCYPLRW